MYQTLHQIKACEVCGNSRLATVLDLGLHPMCDDLVKEGDSRLCNEYPIEIVYCDECYTAHQRFQIPKQELFPSSYHYRSRFTADVLKGMADLVESCEKKMGPLVGKTVLDVGCNDGSLLDWFKTKGATTIGIEPTAAARDAEHKGHAIYNGFFGDDIAAAVVRAHGTPDVITFTNVFAHIENLPAVIRALGSLMTPRTTLVIENHYLGAVLEGNQFDTFYHEHPRTYSYRSFAHIARSLNVSVVDVEFPSRYGGNIRVFMGAPVRTDTPLVNLDRLGTVESGFREGFGVLQGRIERWRSSKREFLAQQVRTHGPLRAKAFPGRSAILVKLLGLDDNSISVVYEKPGSMKIGHYLPGTRIPIASDSDLFALPDQSMPILNLAWHIPREIYDYLTAHGYVGQIIQILHRDDFAVLD